MALDLNKDPYTYAKDYEGFIQDLKQFHTNRGTPFSKLPQLSGRDIDLYLLYRRVIALGGWQKVNDECRWEDIQEEFRIPRACPNGSTALKHIYIRYLDLYEKVRFLGEDPKYERNEYEGEAAARKKSSSLIHGVPLHYNHNQHNVAGYIRQNVGMSCQMYEASDYQKLEKSFLCGLPNEVDFAMNVCLLLSNEGKHIMKLSKSKHLLELMLANVGIFSTGMSSFQQLSEEGWSVSTGRDYVTFWYDTVEDEEVRNLILPFEILSTPKEIVGEDVLNLKREIGINDVEGQRILQMAVILRNLSFEADNCTLMSADPIVFRFLILCSHSKFGCLKQIGLDTLGNLASKFILTANNCDMTEIMLKTIRSCLVSADKFEVVRGLEILSKLCQVEKNEDVLSDKLGQKSYEDIVQLLTIHDIQLIVYTLEALYQLSEIGEATTTKIASVKHAVDVLVSLTTVEAQSYGPNSLVGIKVVEYVPPPQAPEALPGSSGPPSTSQSTNMAAPSTPRQAVIHTPVRQQSAPVHSISTDSQSFACNWLKANFEYKEGSVSQVSIFSDYLAFCGRIPIRDVVNSTTFIDCLRTVFPKAEKVSSDKNGKAEVNVKGLVKRDLPLPVAIPPQVVASSSQNSPRRSQKAPVNKCRVLTMNSTLRQRLSEPPKMQIQGSPYILYPGIGQNQTSNQVTQAMPPASPSSTTYSVSQGSPQMSPSGTPYGTPQHSPMRPMTILQKQLQSPPQNSPGFKKGKKQVKAKLTSINKALQGETPEANSPVTHNSSPSKSFDNILDSTQGGTPKKSSDSNMIKTLLAKKLNENISKQNAAAALQVGEKPMLPPTYQQSWQQNPPSYSPVHQQSIPFSHSTIVNQQLPLAVDGLPVQGATTVQNESHPSNPLLASSQNESLQWHQSRQHVTVDTSQQEQHPIQPVSPSIHNPAENKPRTEPSSDNVSSISSQSPYFQSPNSIETNQPIASQAPGKLKQSEVCTEVESVQNIMGAASETKIEHVENKSVLIADSKLSDSISLPDSNEIPSSEQNDLKPPCVNSSDQIDKLAKTLPVNVDSIEEPMEVDSHNYKSERGNNNKLSNKVISSRTSPTHMVNGCLDESSKDSDLSFMNSPLPHTDDIIPNVKSEYTHVSQKENHSIPNGVSNGPTFLESKENSMDGFTKDEILLRNSSMEKAAKLLQNRNGLVNHLGNGDCYSKDTAVNQKVTECLRDKVHVEDSCDSFSSATGVYRADSISTGAEDCQKSIDLHGDLHRDLNSPPVVREDSKHLPVNGIQVNGLSEGDSNCSSDKIMVHDTVKKELSIAGKDGNPQISSQPEKPQITNITDSKEPSAMEVESPLKPSGAENGHSQPTPDCIMSLANGPVQCVIDSLEVVSSDQVTPKQKSKHSKSKAGSADKTPSKKAKSSEKKPKARKRSRSNTSQAESQSSISSATGADLLCEWDGCKKMFEMPKAVFSHTYLTHLTRPNDGMCKWEGCDKLQRKPWSLVTHVQDHHCSEQALRLAAQRRQQAAQMASPTAQQSAAPAAGQSAPLVYPNDAAIQAIRRFSARPPFQELVEPREGPVTKHIRLTASLVLRNLARYSSVGRSLIKHHEHQMSYSALSAVESSSALANCLWAALHDH